MNKTISTVIPAHNDANALRQALMSVCTQMVPPLEVVVLDDSSTDNTTETVQRFQDAYDFVKYVRYDRKSPNWKRDAYLNALALTTGEYIHSLSSNDIVEPYFYGCANLAINTGLIFGEFAVRGTSGDLMGVAATEMLPGNEDIPRWELLEQLCKIRFFEGGPATLVRRDVLEWLCTREFWRMETWNDSIGYSVAAWFFGGVYLPYPCGTFTFDPGSDGEKKKHSNDWPVPMYREVCRFLDTLQGVEVNGRVIPPRLDRALRQKVYNTVPRHLRAAEMAGVEFQMPGACSEPAATPAASGSESAASDVPVVTLSGSSSAEQTFPSAAAVILPSASESP